MTAELIGTVLDSRYRIDAILGRGGMGAVYRAQHLLLDQAVAIKVLLPDLAADEVSAQRFIREAKGTFRLNHPHIVRVSDFGATQDGILYIVMEHLDGRTVGRELAIDGPMSGRRCAHILAQTASALQHAHNAGLIHRDLKGDNIMLVRQGDDVDFVKILDFGLAKLWDADGGGLSTIMSVAALTQEGMTFGTPHFMSPEQALGGSLTPASDIYTLGVNGYQMLTGLLPFAETSPVKILTAIIQKSPAPPRERRPDLTFDPDLEAFLMRCMSKEPAQRPGPASAVAQELERLARGEAAAAAGPVGGVSMSETVQLGPDAVSTMPLRSPAGAAPVLDTRAVIAAGVRRPSWFLPALAIVAVLFVAALVLFGSEQQPGAVDAGIAHSVAEDAAPSVALARTVDASATADAAVGESQPEAAKLASLSADATPTRTESHRPRTLTAEQKRAKNLVRAARAASSNLARMARADAALRLDPKNLEARYLFGAALLESGDRTRGCRELKRARRLRQARAEYRSAGCGKASD